MNLEDKYPTLEQSKRIAELLGKNAPESECMWYHDHHSPIPEWLIIESVEGLQREHYRAYDLAELGEMLQFKLGHLSMIEKQPNKTWGWAKTNDDGTGYYIMEYPNESQARAALLIHLLELQKD